MKLSGEISAAELHLLRASHPNITVLDVRETDEVALAALEGTVHIPVGELPVRIGELSPNRPIVVLCHSGFRSAHAAAHLRRSGFTDVANLRGGIDAWSRDIDPSVPRY